MNRHSCGAADDNKKSSLLACWRPSITVCPVIQSDRILTASLTEQETLRQHAPENFVLQDELMKKRRRAMACRKAHDQPGVPLMQRVKPRHGFRREPCKRGWDQEAEKTHRLPGTPSPEIAQQDFRQKQHIERVLCSKGEYPVHRHEKVRQMPAFRQTPDNAEHHNCGQQDAGCQMRDHHQMMDGFCWPVPGFAKSKLKQHQKGRHPVKDDRRPVVTQQAICDVRR
ncbi:hypothetical protein SRCM100623_00425 [Acetobacter pasteurianus]|uniref:Uncharacterized protein n=1 Tax=Acetobacter pasteurianus TaxID=438 RepID=A0A1A0DK12_ACEPA|nr:hypothetical protein SRCM100623_00425 [Acetobacter pasteurianus]GCD51155.1 hypothetical protein NBRC106471_2711 [Acetobacter pasteurianus subsp. pasteurianus LMG 1262 = NBRC 106471]